MNTNKAINKRSRLPSPYPLPPRKLMNYRSEMIESHPFIMRLTKLLGYFVWWHGYYSLDQNQSQGANYVRFNEWIFSFRFVCFSE